MKIGSSLVLFGILAFSPIFFLQAQTESQAISADDITGIVTIGLIPENPSPGENVTASIDAPGLNIDASTITWSIDGKIIKSGRGVKDIDFTMGPLGTTQTIRVSIDSEGKIYNKSIVLRSADIDFLWQGDTYIPPFYKGRGLWSRQSKLTILAIPHIPNGRGGEINPNILVYKWTKNGTVLGNISGAGKSSISFTDNILSLPQEIQLDVYTSDGILAATKNQTFVSGNPKLNIYENHPLYGYLFNYEVGNTYKLTRNEISFAGFPYFFSGESKNSPDLDFSWITNAGPSQRTGEVIFRTPENLTGQAYIESAVESKSKILQTSTRDFLVQFNDEDRF